MLLYQDTLSHIDTDLATIISLLCLATIIIFSD